MKKLGVAIACVCIGTLLTQGAGLALLWSKGQLNKTTTAKLLAVLYGIEPRAPEVAADGAAAPEDREQTSWEQIEQARVLHMRQIEMREQALAAEASRLRALQASLETDRGTYDRTKTAFEDKLKADREGVLAAGRDSVRALWENMKTKQAKDEIVQTYEGGDVDKVVSIFAAMAPNKQAKIAAEFKSPKEQQVLNEITQAILDGKPLATMIDEAQQNLSPAAEGSPP
jgi:flagellar motility protein MotE (MotC chaperone)